MCFAGYIAPVKVIEDTIAFLALYGKVWDALKMALYGKVWDALKMINSN